MKDARSLCRVGDRVRVVDQRSRHYLAMGRVMGSAPDICGGDMYYLIRIDRHQPGRFPADVEPLWLSEQHIRPEAT